MLGRLRLPALVALLLCVVVGRPSTQTAEPTELAEARRLFEALDYERSLLLLDRVIPRLDPRGEAQQREWLIDAYQMRGRARFGTGDREGAAADFEALLGIDASFTLDEGVSPRIVAVLDEVRRQTLGTLELTLVPDDALLQVDGVPLTPTPDGRLLLPAGGHLLRATRPGYRDRELPVTIDAGEVVPLELSLERISSVVSIVTSPPGIEVVVDGQSRGRTDAGALPEDLAHVPGTLGVPPAEVSQPLLIADMEPGTYELELRRDCYETVRRKLDVERLSDVVLEPVVLVPAVGTIDVISEPEGAEVFLDGDTRGFAPMSLTGVCAGAHTVELRGDEGRAVERLTVETGANLEVRQPLRPAFALLAGPEVLDGQDDPRLSAERVLGGASQVMLWAPDPAAVKGALEPAPLDASWFGLDESQPTPATADRMARIAGIAERLGTQGVAWVQPAAPGSSDVEVALVAAGAAEPDVLTVSLSEPDSVTRAVERLDSPLSLVGPSLGALVIDVLPFASPVVAQVDPGGAAEAAGLKVGDVVESAGGTEVASAAELERLLAAQPPGEALALAVMGADSQTRRVELRPRQAPALLTGTDRFLPTNVAIASLRTRLATEGDGDAGPAIRLNLAAALLRAGDPAGARALLEATSLPPGPGVSQGTVQYLLGQALEASGDREGAKRAWSAAAKAEGRLTADGPLVNALARRALARLE